jgi:hypothetical protein
LDVIVEVPHDKKNKIVQFVAMFHLLFKGRAMMDCEGLRDMFIMLKVKHTPKKDWIDYLSWGIVESMNDLLLQSTCNVVNATNFLFVSAHGVKTIDNASWISLHIYVVQSWKRICLLICVEKLEVKGTIDNVF